jgi:hypothetical protein
MTIDKIETPREFFEHVVNLDAKDFLEMPTELRLAYHACTSLLSLRDWIYQSYNNRGWTWSTHSQGNMTSIGELQRSLNAIDQVFGITTDIANATKHMILDPDRRQTSLYGAANLQIQTVTKVLGGSMLNTDMLGNFMLNQNPTAVTSNRVRVQIGSVYYDVLSCVLLAKDIWSNLIEENAW